MAVRYAENLTLLRSATGGNSDKGIRGGHTEGAEKTDAETDSCMDCYVLYCLWRIGEG